MSPRVPAPKPDEPSYQQYDITEARVVIVPCRIKRED